MSVDPQQGQQQGPQMPQQAPIVPADAALGVNQMLNAIEKAASKAAMASSAAEFNDFAKGALAFAQAIITLDPTRLAGGDTPAGRAAATPQRPPVNDANHDGIIGQGK